VEHGLRPAGESRGDARAVKALCEKLDVPCRVISIAQGRIAAFAAKSGLGIEGAARFFRHRAWNWERQRVGADSILTGHTKDDLLETLLMRVLRGSGPAGLSPMRRGKGRINRPLLALTRQDVLKYLEERAIPYRTDLTNADTSFFRNRIRHKLIPQLDEFFPHWRASLLAMAETQALTAEFLASEVAKRLSWNMTGKAGKSPSLTLSEFEFFNAPPILREEAVFAGADKLAVLKPRGRNKAPAKLPRRAAVRLSVQNGGAPCAQDLGPVRLERKGGRITLAPRIRSPFERGFSLLIKEAGSYTLKARVLGTKKALCINAGISQVGENPSPREQIFSGGFFASFPIVFRNHRKGDCILRGGHERRFSDIINRGACGLYSGIITVCDTIGLAAFIVAVGGDLLVISRDGDSADGDKSHIKVFLKT